MWGVNSVLDRSIFFSFDRTGFARHQKNFNQRDLSVSLQNKLAIVTGANSGIGFETAKALVKMGAQVILVCRDKEKGEKALSKIGGNARLELLDISDLEAIRSFASKLKNSHVDLLIHNAGVLLSSRQLTPQGIELTFATHVLGPFLLTKLLIPKLLAAKNARVIFVTSGGMYLQKINLPKFQSAQGPFNGVNAYANAKRAQVILTEIWSEKFSSKEIGFHSMHPGWANTPGVKKSLPIFWRLMKNRLRSPEEGADTAIWLASCEKISNFSGKLWFDRGVVPTHIFPWTHEKQEDRRELWELCEKLTNPYLI